jgi:tetratricopeptide (TPR) repeat protein
MNRGFRVAVGACQSTSQHTAYSPWRQAFRILFGLEDEPLDRKDLTSWVSRQQARVQAALEEANPDWLARLPLLGDLLGVPIPDNEVTAAFDPRLRQEALIALIVDLVRTWARDRPLLLLVEDAHWLDEASQALALALGRIVVGLPVLLALIHRPPSHAEDPLLPELDRLSGYHRVTLGKLSPSAVASLVSNHLSGQVSSLALSLIQAQVQGNPFFAEELVTAMREAEDLCLQEDGAWRLSEAVFGALLRANCLTRDAQSGQWMLASDAPLSAVDLDLPDTTQAVVLSRLDRLPEAYNVTLKAASVIGTTFEFDLLARCHPLQPGRAVLLEQLETLEGRDRIRLETPLPGLSYSFRHHITQEVVYDALLEVQQRELHLAVGESLETLQPEAVERLAYHYSHSDLRDKTLFYLDRAARKAQREYANETALSFYNQALALEERSERLKGKVEALHILGRRDEEQASLRALGATPEAAAVDVGYLWGQYYEAIGEYGPAQAAVERALPACRDSGDVLGEVRCLAQLGLIARRQAEYNTAKERYGQALDLLEGSHPDEEIRILNGLGTVYRALGDFEQARANYEQALILSRTRGNRIQEAEALNNLGGVAYYQSEFAKARALYLQAFEIQRVIGHRAGEGASLGNLALASRDAGDYTQAQKYLSEAQSIHRVIGNRWEEVNDWNDLGVLLYFLGDLPAAQTCLQRGLELSQEIGDEAGQAYVLGNLGLVVRDLGDLTVAEQLLTDGLALARGQADRYAESYFLSHLGIVYLRGGRLDQAIDQAVAALTLRRELELSLWATADLTTLALAHLTSGDIDHALDYAQQALTVLEDCGGEGPEFPARDYFVCYQVLSATGKKEAAHAALQSAYDLVMGRANKIVDPALHHSFLEEVQLNRIVVKQYTETVG